MPKTDLASRRAMLKSASVLGLAVLATPVTANTTKHISPTLRQQFAALLALWQKHEVQQPEAYLASKNALGAGKQIKQAEFRSGEVLEVDGVVMAKIEVAALCVMAKQGKLV